MNKYINTENIILACLGAGLFLLIALKGGWLVAVKAYLLFGLLLSSIYVTFVVLSLVLRTKQLFLKNKLLLSVSLFTALVIASLFVNQVEATIKSIQFGLLFGVTFVLYFRLMKFFRK